MIVNKKIVNKAPLRRHKYNQLYVVNDKGYVWCKDIINYKNVLEYIKSNNIFDWTKIYFFVED